MAAARLARWVLGAFVLGVSACGSGDEDRLKLTTPNAPPPARTPAPAQAAEPVTRAERDAITGWADTLRHGHPARAARYFALPAYIANNSPVYRLKTRAQVAYFNRTLPCGAEVVTLERTA